MDNPITRRNFLRLAALAGGAALTAACTKDGDSLSVQETENIRRLVILCTNDEHGWLEPGEDTGGALSLVSRWRKQEPDYLGGRCLLLSSGDLWTGPALSSWFHGEPMIEAMNLMGYQAATLGNHDFDYGLNTLRERQTQASFPFLSANIRDRQDDSVPDFVRPYTLLELHGVRAGVIGLTTLETPVDTRPAYVEGLKFLPYEEALKTCVPQVLAAGAELILVLGHLCTSELRALSPVAAALGVHLMCGGHCHEETNESLEGVLLIQSGAYLRGYTRVELIFDRSAGKVMRSQAAFYKNEPGKSDPSIARLVEQWSARVEPSFWESIGYLGSKVGRNSTQMADLLYQSWSRMESSADVVLASPRYVHSLPAGEISAASIVSMLPTENQLVALNMAGAQLLELIQERQPLVGGLDEGEAGYSLKNGKPWDLEARYRVLLPEALYEGGNYYQVRQYAASEAILGIDWRASIIDWIRSLNTSRSRPLEDYLGP